MQVPHLIGRTRHLPHLLAILASCVVGSATHAQAREDWTPDRRPALSIPLFNGQLNNRGLSVGWYQNDEVVNHTPTQQEIEDATNALLWLLDAGYADGWRRFIFTLPAGTYCGACSGNQWTALPEWKQELIYVEITAWLALHSDATVGVYSGGKHCTASWSLCTEISEDCYNCDNDELVFHTAAASGDGLSVLSWNVLGYMGCGFTEYFIDAASTNPPEMSDIFSVPYFYGYIRMGGEAIPFVWNGSQNVVDPDYKDHNPWVGLVEYVDAFLGDVLDARNDFDLETTEICLWFDHTTLFDGEGVNPAQEHTISLDDMKTLVQRGWVPWTGWNFPGADYVTTRIEMLKRIYSFGHIDNIEDFNYDGIVNSLDIADFIYAYFQHLNQPGNFIHGDVTGDGLVDSNDADFFSDCYSGGTPAPVNFGGPEPQYAHLP